VPWSALPSSIPGTGTVVTMPRQTTPNDDSGTDSTATDQALADELDMDIGGDGADIDARQSLVSDLGDEVTPPRFECS